MQDYIIATGTTYQGQLQQFVASSSDGSVVVASDRIEQEVGRGKNGQKGRVKMKVCEG